MTVYADVLFLINFCTDYLLLTAVGRMLHRGSRLWLGAAAGGGYALLCVWYPPLSHWAIRFCAACGMAALCFRPHSAAEFGRTVGLFLTLSALQGGIWYALCAGRQTIPVGGVFYAELSLWKFAAMTGGCFVFFCLAERFWKRIPKLRTVTISHRGESVELTALEDSGCRVSEPMTGMAVMLAERTAIEPLLSPQLRGYLAGGAPDGIEEKIYPLSCRTAFCESCFLTAFLPDEVTVSDRTGKRTRRHLLVGILQNDLTGDQSYRALLPVGAAE